ncbi:antitoxin [Desulfobacter vibrioformis]|uniref:antitoxin n=1 Tax=Desulfobacter vibrioformis TaxID=34031 RepID=UPI00054E50A1|nr:antitoxin [Desulfobacter vibrioformis]
MKTMTIRGVEPKLAEKLKQTAQEKGQSVNQLILEMIQERLGMKKQKLYSREYDDLDRLWGRWSDTEFKTIEDNISKERRIDPEIWE